MNDDDSNLTLYPQKEPSDVSSYQVLSIEDVDMRSPDIPQNLSVDNVIASSSYMTQ